jgi:hypothetical protein
MESLIYLARGSLVNTRFGIVMKFLVLIMMFFVSSHTLAACEEPSPPELPNAQTAVIAEMVKAKKDVKKYMDAAKEYTACTRNDMRHDRVVDSMNDIAKQFNELVQAYKERVNN